MSTQKTQKQVKYRPSLTAAQITHILTLAKKDMLSPHSVSVVSTLAPFQAKIEASAITPAYTTTPTQTLESKLGLEHIGKANSLEDTVGDTGEIFNKEQYWESCYHKHLATPAECSLSELQAAKEHMYLNELMSPEETAAFERGEI